MAKIDNENHIGSLKEGQYKELLGVDKPTFDKMYGILLDAHAQLHKNGGKPPKLTVLDKIVITLGYWREYRTYCNIAFDYSVTKTAIGKSVIWVEDVLIKDGIFSLPSKREMQRKDNIGSEHDFTIFKRIFGWADPDVCFLGDRGFREFTTSTKIAGSHTRNQRVAS